MEGSGDDGSNGGQKCYEISWLSTFNLPVLHIADAAAQASHPQSKTLPLPFSAVIMMTD